MTPAEHYARAQELLHEHVEDVLGALTPDEQATLAELTTKLRARAQGGA